MVDVKIVLGLGFGDEGKGITTDYLCSLNYRTKIVVRFSGGQQAGHTVMRNGIKHIFSSFGSGTLQHIPTYWSEHCTIYPVSMFNEWLTLSKLGFEPIVFFHPLTKITTPMDVLFNRIRDEKLKHGTVGLGVGATMAREADNYCLRAIDLLHMGMFRQKYQAIRNYYIKKIDASYFKDFFEQLSLLEPLFFERLHLIKLCNIAPYEEILSKFQEVIFEGSQGILLDKDFGIFPNVTYSSTTSKNVFDVIKNLQVRNFQTYYVTRCYQTRHGNGWMSNQNPLKLINNEEEINMDGGYQGEFRIGSLDEDLIRYSLKADSLFNQRPEKQLVVTCLDQIPDINVNPFKKFRLPVIGSYSPDSKDFKYIGL